MDEIREVAVIAELEGLTIEEAKLTYAEREKLSAGAFCGPDRSYPSHDAKHVRAGLQRLSQFGRKMSRNIALKIFRCLVSRARKYKIEVNKEKFAWLTGKKTIEETCSEIDAHDKELLKWLFTELESDGGE